MTKKQNTKAKSCFIITPIGADNSDIRRHAEGVIKSVIKPILCDIFKFEDVKAAHEINASGSINNQLMGRILDNDLVIANLTGVNPNVMYEVAVRHATAKPIIHICEKGTKLPFDIVDQRTIFYTDDMLGVQELKERLENMVGEAIKTKTFKDNPIYNATKKKIIIESITNDPDKGFEKYLIDRLDGIDRKIDSVNNNNSVSSSDYMFDSLEILFDPLNDAITFSEIEDKFSNYFIKAAIFQIRKIRNYFRIQLIYLKNRPDTPETTEIRVKEMGYKLIDVRHSLKKFNHAEAKQIFGDFLN